MAHLDNASNLLPYQFSKQVHYNKFLFLVDHCVEADMWIAASFNRCDFDIYRELLLSIISET